MKSFVIKFDKTPVETISSSYSKTYDAFVLSEPGKILQLLLDRGFVVAPGRFKTLHDVWESRGRFIDDWFNWNHIIIGHQTPDGCIKTIHCSWAESDYKFWQEEITIEKFIELYDTDKLGNSPVETDYKVKILKNRMESIWNTMPYIYDGRPPQFININFTINHDGIATFDTPPTAI